MQQSCLHGVYRRSPLSHRTSAFEWNLRLGPDMTPKTTGAPRAQNTNLTSRWSGEMEHFNQEGLDFMAPSTAQYFKVCETSFQHHTELKSRFILNALSYRNKLLDSYVQRNHIQVCNRREWACLLERQREGGREGCWSWTPDGGGGLFWRTFHLSHFSFKYVSILSLTGRTCNSTLLNQNTPPLCLKSVVRHSNVQFFFIYFFFIFIFFFSIFGVNFLKNPNLAQILKQTSKQTKKNTLLGNK